MQLCQFAKHTTLGTALYVRGLYKHDFCPQMAAVTMTFGRRGTQMSLARNGACCHPVMGHFSWRRHAPYLGLHNCTGTFLTARKSVV